MDVINFFKFIEQKYPEYDYATFSKKPGRAYPIEGEGELIDGIRYGKFITYRQGGRIERIETYEDGLENGKSTLFHDNGVVSSEGYFVNGIRQGELTTYREDGTKNRMHTYKNNLINGPYKEYYEDGTLKSEGVHGKVEGRNIFGHGDVGTKIDYFRNGNLQRIKNYDTDEFIKYYETGVKELERIKIDDDDNYKLIAYHPNGNLSSIKHFQIRQEEKSFSPSIVTTVRTKVLHGENIYYDINGNERVRELFRDGKFIK